MLGPLHNPYRLAGRAELAQAMAEVRAHSLALMRAWEEALPTLSVPQADTLNPPLWEWGHIAWFQEWWTIRHPQRYRGIRSDSAETGFAASVMPGADERYNSSRVAHATRWSLPLPGMDATLAYLAQVQAQSLAGLQAAPDESDESLYFWRLALCHEAMHQEASLYMAQSLGLAWPEGLGRRDPPKTPAAPGEATLQIAATRLNMGHRGLGFAFDNECPDHVVSLEAFEIDARSVRWGAYVAFLADTGHPAPQVLRHEGGQWLLRRFGRWLPLPMDEAAVHVRAGDAQAWCLWAGRRLPTEAQWCAAANHPAFEWGEVWEWTASPFQPWPGFEAHPYQDYSKPWWGTHRVLKGASWATPACLPDVRFRNFFTPGRDDVMAGFRSVSAA